MPGTAQPAIQEGKYVGKVVKARLDRRAGAASRSTTATSGSIAAIGRTSAVADLFGKFRLGGPIAFLIWGVVHLAYLVGLGQPLRGGRRGGCGRSSPATAASA